MSATASDTAFPAPHGSARVHEPRRGDCPWCGSARLRTRLRTGTCAGTGPDCSPSTSAATAGTPSRTPAHPRGPGLLSAGRARRPRDPATERVLALHAVRHRRRAAARAMLPFGEPESWLDVGTGLARFPQTAREFFPYTAFDGTDLTVRVERARDLGRVEEAHVGALTDPGCWPGWPAATTWSACCTTWSAPPTRAPNCAPPWTRCAPAATC